jgi:hypothetical protein
MTERIRMRHAMYLSAYLVPIFMGTRRTPREALMGVKKALRKLGDLEKCKPLLDWLRVVVTCDGALAIERASGPTSPITENCLHKRLIRLVKQDLPGWEQIETSASREVARSPNFNLEELMAQFLLQQQPWVLKRIVFSLRRYPIKIQQSYFTIPSIILRQLLVALSV